MEEGQCCGGYSMLWRIFSNVEKIITVKEVQCYEGSSLLLRKFSTVREVHYCEGSSVLLESSLSTVGNVLSTV